MANTFYEVQESELLFQNGNMVLSASQTITGDGNSASFKVGKGIQDVVVDITVEDITIAVANHFIFFVEANSLSAASTWKQIACLPVNGVEIDGIGKFVMTVKNPYDNQIRLRWVEVGTASITFNSSIHPVM